MHRTIAEALAQLPGTQPAEIAHQYQRSAVLPGREVGAIWALRAAEEARAAYAWERVVDFTEMALGLMEADDERVPEVTGELGHALPFVQRPEDAIEAMKLWASALFERGKVEEGLDYLMLGHRALAGVGFGTAALDLARFAEPHFLGLDSPATILFRSLLLQNAEELAPDYPGIPLTSPEKEALVTTWMALPESSKHHSLQRSISMFC